MSYTIPESPVPELGDTSYDGERQQGILTGGLGRLTDGETGNDNYKQNINPEKGELLFQRFIKTIARPVKPFVIR